MFRPPSFEVRRLGRPLRPHAASLLALGALFAGYVGCAAQATGSSDGYPPPQSSTNSCFAGAPCLGGFCDDDGFCRSESTSVRALLLEVTPAADTTTIAGVRFMQEVPEVPPGGQHDLNLAPISRIEMAVRGAAISESQCVLPSG